MRVAASLTAADPLRLGDAAQRLAVAGVDAVHLDLGDGAFVPWLGGSVEMVAAMSACTALPVDVHLMLREPERYLPLLAAAGAASVAAHVEAAPYPWRLRETARRLGMKFGLAVNPATPIAALEPLRECADYFSLLTTEPDGAGERMLPSTARRLTAAAALLGPGAEIEVDGGVNADNASEVRGRGATRLVVGRALVEAENPAEIAARLRSDAGPGSRGLFWSPGLVRRFASADHAEDAIRMVGGLLVGAGAVTPEHVEAAVRRELEHPTGLPARVPFALVHTDAPGALVLAAGLGVFDQPVAFKRMDDPAQVLPVRIVVMLAVPQRHMQAELLSRLITSLADPELAQRLISLPSPEALHLLTAVAA